LVGHIVKWIVAEDYAIECANYDDCQACTVVKDYIPDAKGYRKDIELRIRFSSPNEVVSTLAQKEGFKFKGRSRRMVFGPRRYHGIPQGVYGIAGPEKG
jgi:hypothetical protein